ncbi:MAG: FG-GAP-like repeat-containing protein [Acidobacteriota bacterium]|nr:FG-GAP-like repeat-containing protein [Acidobacteriota bacterium]
MKSKNLKALKFFAVTAAFAVGMFAILNNLQSHGTVSANASGPPPSHTAAPGEQFCVACHIGGELKESKQSVGGNGITISGVPAEYALGASYVVSVTIQDNINPTMFGFQLTAIDSTGSTPGIFALTHLPGQMQILNGLPPLQARTYVEHTAAGTVPVVNGSKTWQFTWTAPTVNVGPITLYAAGNAANQNGIETGDNIHLTNFTTQPEQTQADPARFDFDGDAKTDISIFRPAPGEWWYLRSSDGGNAAFQFGASTDTIVPADYTGDGKTDIGFFRPSSGEWFILRSEDSSFYSFPFGGSGDIPAPGDYDGDGQADPAVFRPSSATWFILNSGGGTTITTFGVNGDLPVVEDYDGDGSDDIAIFRPSVSEWWINRSQEGLTAFQFGSGGDRTAPADYTGDGKADVAFFRPTSGEWFILRSEDTSFFAFPFGGPGDIPVPGDYDGDGKADPAVFRPSDNTWYKLQSTNGFEAIGFGATGDVPLPSAYVRP